MLITDEIKRYYSRKTTCPRCKSKDILETGITLLEGFPAGKYKDIKNITQCKQCDWRGVVDDLKG